MMRCFWKENIDANVFDNVLQKAKHLANDVYRPPLSFNKVGWGALRGFDLSLSNFCSPCETLWDFVRLCETPCWLKSSIPVEQSRFAPDKISLLFQTSFVEFLVKKASWSLGRVTTPDTADTLRVLCDTAQLNWIRLFACCILGAPL